MQQLSFFDKEEPQIGVARVVHKPDIKTIDPKPKIKQSEFKKLLVTYPETFAVQSTFLGTTSPYVYGPDWDLVE